MFAIVITEKGGEQRRISFNKAEITIGRVQGNDIVLPKGNVSKRHARIVLKDGKFIIVDLKSTNGTYVNGRKITSPLVVKEADKIYIGDFIMGVEEDGGDVLDDDNLADEVPETPPPAAPPAPAPMPMPMMREPVREPPPRMDPPRELAPMPRPDPAGGAASPELLRAALGRQEPPRPELDRGLPRPELDRGLPRPTPAAGPPPAAPRRPPIPGTLPPPAGLASPAPLPSPASSGERPLPPVGPAMAPSIAGVAPPSMGLRGPASPSSPPPIAPAAAPTSIVPPGPPPPMPLPSHLAPPPSAPQLSPAMTAPLPADLRPAAPVTPASTPRGLEARAAASRPVAGPRPRGAMIEPLDARAIKLLDLQTRVLERLRAQLDLDALPPEAFADEDLWRRAERTTTELVEGLGATGELPRSIEPGLLVKETLNEALGLGPLEDLLADEGVDEIRVERRDRIAVAGHAGWRGAGKAFSSDDALYRVLARLLAPIGRRLDEIGPLVDVRLRDGARLTAVLPPVALLGPSLSLRKPRRLRRTLPDLVAAGTLSEAMGAFLGICTAARRNLIVCGAPGAGKTALISALAAGTPPSERVVSIEDTAQLALDRDAWIALEATPAADLGALLRVALRLAPDRLVVGDVQGKEALALASALAGSVEGAIVGVAADGPQAALARWAGLARLADGAADDPVRALVASAADIVLHVARGADGVSRIVAIDEVRGASGGGFETQSLFVHRRDSGFAATGATPAFWPELAARGVPADAGIFQT